MSKFRFVCFVLVTGSLWAMSAQPVRAELIPLPNPTIIDSAEALWPVGNILDGIVSTEYASNKKGVDTFISFDFGTATLIAGFEHVDRDDVALVDTADLVFSSVSDFSSVIETVAVDHVGTVGGTTSVTFDPVTARYVKWDVTALVDTTKRYIGGAEITFSTVPEPSTLILLGLSSLALLVPARRRWRNR